MNTGKVLFISGAISLLYISCAEETPAEVTKKDVICVKAETLPESEASMPIHGSGVLSSKRMIKLSFKTGGVISKVKVDVGSQVRKGQVIAALDMTEIQSQAEQASLALEKADRDFKRVKNLYNDTVATLEQLQDASSAYEAAMRNKNIAEFNVRYSSIVAPADGRIIAKLAEENELIGPGMPVLVFSELGKDEWVVKTGISDKDIVRVKLGDRADILLDAFPDIKFPAKVSQIAESADPLSGTFEIEIAVDPLNERLINGMVADVKVESLNPRNITFVPPDAVTEADGRKGYVFVVESADSTVKKVPVTIAYFQGTLIAVNEILSELGPVITEGASYLEVGSKVNIVR